MRRVLYTRDMEPITILETTPATERYLLREGIAILACYEPIKLVTGPRQEQTLRLRTVSIMAERLCLAWEPARDHTRHLLLFTADEESAMLLKCAFLPGQQGALRDVEKDGFRRGFITAFMGLGDE